MFCHMLIAASRSGGQIVEVKTFRLNYSDGSLALLSEGPACV